MEGVDSRSTTMGDVGTDDYSRFDLRCIFGVNWAGVVGYNYRHCGALLMMDALGRY